MMLSHDYNFVVGVHCTLFRGAACTGCSYQTGVLIQWNGLVEWTSGME